MMPSWYRADLHVHTVLSPCAELEMGPRDVIEECKRLGISILGVTDHNQGGNIPAFMEVGKREGITIIPGMELQTREEVHLLCLFPHLLAFQSFEEVVAKTLPSIPHNEALFGSQILVDSDEGIVGFYEYLLLVSSSLSVSEAVDLVKEHGGLVIPSHIERQAYGILVNLGFIPPNSGFLALEIFNYSRREELLATFPYLEEHAWIVSSDAHQLKALDGEWATYFYVKEPLFEELVKALQGLSGRKVVVLPKDRAP